MKRGIHICVQVQKTNEPASSWFENRQRPIHSRRLGDTIHPAFVAAIRIHLRHY
jgi:hypothetical protein